MLMLEAEHTQPPAYLQTFNSGIKDWDPICQVHNISLPWEDILCIYRYNNLQGIHPTVLSTKNFLEN